MSAICNACLEARIKAGGDVELWTRPFVPEPCIGCGKPTEDRGTPWTSLPPLQQGSGQSHPNDN